MKIKCEDIKYRQMSIFGHYLGHPFPINFLNWDSFITIIKYFCAVKNNINMKRTIFFLLAVIAIAGCVKDPATDEPQTPEYNSFDFSTKGNVTLNVDYGFNAETPFQVFTQDPLIYGEHGTFVSDTTIHPIAVGCTDESGLYSGSIEVPDFVSEIYIMTSAFYVPTLIKAAIINGTADATVSTQSESGSTKAEGTYIDSFEGRPSIKNWNCWLGKVDSYSGRPDYILPEDAFMTIDEATRTEIYQTMNNVISINQSCPDEYRTDVDLLVSEDANIVLTMMGGNTCWNSSIGYYYYEEGDVPNSVSDLNVIALFPNTQDGKWTAGRPINQGIDRGNAVKLMYYPNIAEGSKEGATDVFPAGIYVGLILAVNGWNDPTVQGDVYEGAQTGYYSCSTKGLSNRGYNNIDVHTAIFRYGSYGVITFEDYKDDQNFSDVSLTMTSNPVNAVANIPVIYPVQQEMEQYDEGLYLFEDVWPNQGDYDMNDVMVQYQRTTRKNTSGGRENINKITAQTFYLTVYSNFAGNTDNGLSISLSDLNGMSYSITGSIMKAGESKYTETSFETAPDNTIRLTDNINDHLGDTFRVELKYSGNLSTESPYCKVFVSRKNGQLETHIPMEAPTSNADWTYFGQGKDRSDVATGVFYVSDGNYPFGIFLSEAYLDTEGYEPLLDPDTESVRIDVLFPLYSSWVESDGEENQDWYLYPAN